MKNKSWLIIGVLTYTILLALSILYFKERTVILDVAYQLFHILKNDYFAIQVNRFGAAVTQVFPLLGSMVGFSLHSIAILYSISFVVYYFISFLFTWFGLKNYRMALVILLFNTLITTHSFFWIQCELIQGAVFTLIYLGAIENQLKKGILSERFLVFSPVALLVMVFFYPLLPVIFFFGLLFLYLQYSIKGRWLIGIGISLVIIYLIKIVFFKTTYDSNSMSQLINFKTIFPDYFTIQSNKNFGKWLIRDYYLLIICSIWIIVSYVLNKEYKKLTLFVLFIFGFTALVNVSYYDGTAHQFYLEPQYSVLSIFIAFPLVYDILPNMKIRKSNLIFCVIMLLCFLRISIVGKEYVQRVEWYRATLKSSKDKLVLKESEVPLDVLKLAWGASFEFWLLSTIETKQTRSIIIEEKPNEFDWINNTPQIFITKWGAYEYDQLNNKYFILKDTTTIYEKK